MLNIAVFGCGRIGKIHAASIATLPGARLAAVTDALPEAATGLAAELGCTAQDADTILSDPAVDAIVIATPTTTHYDLIHAAAAAGKAVFCEKPVDLDTARVVSCQRAVDAAGVPFLTAFQRRFDPHLGALGRRLREGAAGSVELIVMASRDPGPPPIDYIKTSGGLFRDMMIHDLDMARFLMDEAFATVHAVGACHVDPAIAEAGDIDTAAVTLTTASGRICQITCSRRASYGYDQRVEVHGSKAMLRVDNLRENLIEVADAGGMARAKPLHFFLDRYAAAYRAEMAYFITCLATGEALSPGIADGLAAQRLADAAHRSFESGSVVTL